MNSNKIKQKNKKFHKIKWKDNGKEEICNDWDLEIYNFEAKNILNRKTFTYLGSATEAEYIIFVAGC